MAKTIPTNLDQQSATTNVESLIKVIRGQQVMLDKDLATLYGVETRVLNQAVKRNIERFPEDFRFQLSKEECSKSQIVTLNEGRGHNIKKLPYAFTEQGVAMLSGVLRSPTAVAVNVQIMRAFVAMRRFLVSNASVFQRLETIEHHQLEMQLSQHPDRGEPLPPLPRPLSLHRRGGLSRWRIHQGLGQEVVRILQDGAAISRRIGGENQPRMKGQNHIFFKQENTGTFAPFPCLFRFILSLTHQRPTS